MVMIILSAVHLGAQTEYMARNSVGTPPPVFRAFEVMFMLFFCGELMLRLGAFGRWYFTMKDWHWNGLDFLLVAMQLIEEILNHATSDDSNPLSSRLLRIVRMLRAVRVMRVLHTMKFAEELRLLASCVAHSARNFHWAAALIGLMVYIVGVHLTQVTLFIRLDMIGDREAATPSSDLEQWYGSLPRAVLSLFQGLTGGVDWNELVQPLMVQLSPWAGVLFSVYMAFAILAVMNVITGTFVQSAMERATQNDELRKVHQARRFFTSIDRNHEGVITFEEIEQNLDSQELKDFFRSIDVDLSDAKHLFDMLDAHNTGRINFNDFLGGCMRLHGPAKALDLVLVMRELKELWLQSIAPRLNFENTISNDLNEQPLN